MGRPSSYTAEVAGAICERIANGEPLKRICADELMPSYQTVRVWIKTNPEFADLSTRAYETGCHALADECLDIADTAKNDWMEFEENDDVGYRLNGENIQRSKLRIETRMRLIGKWLPKVYGDRQHIEHSGKLGLESLVAGDDDKAA